MYLAALSHSSVCASVQVNQPGRHFMQAILSASLCLLPAGLCISVSNAENGVQAVCLAPYACLCV